MTNSTIDTPMPTEIDLEREVLGAALYHPGGSSAALRLLSRGAFSDDGHQKIYAAIASLERAGDRVDIVTVSNVLKKHGWLEEIGVEGIKGESYLNALQYEHSCALESVEARAKIINATAACRQDILAYHRAISDLYTGAKSAEEVYAEIESKHGGTASAASEHKTKHIRDISLDDEVAESGLSTGFEAIDNMIPGLQKGALIVLGGRPSMGKTALALSIARNVAIRAGKVVLMFSLEMTEKQIARRVYGAEARVGIHKMRDYKSSPAYSERVESVRAQLKNAALLINDNPIITVPNIRSEAKAIKSRYGLDLVIVDHIHLVTPDRKSNNSNQDLTQISRALKILAKQLDVPVIVLSQLSRAVESRKDDNHRPKLSDLRESGAIEQDADVVMLVYREEVYVRDNPLLEGQAEVIIAKQRDGAIGTANLRFVRWYASFEDVQGEALAKPD
ncbi:MAG: replicative DNA helicase [Chitinispirillia bacterium]|nr:replicative DNA helicase [Chitinispirillia bacterium]MCL2241342.1 replicative DNA helicase [Chitinispirillia bacterium]